MPLSRRLCVLVVMLVPGSGLAAGLDHLLEDASTAEDSAKTIERGVRLGALGSGSDYTVFIDHLTIASLNLGYGGGQPADGSHLFGPDDLGLGLAQFPGALFNPSLQVGRRLAELFDQARILDKYRRLVGIDLGQAKSGAVESLGARLAKQIQDAENPLASDKGD